MSLILFAIIGAQIEANPWYWITYGIYAFCKLIGYAVKLFGDD